jgi:tetratricopeptide (TPR) repeat protein
MNKSVIQNAIEQRDPTLARDALREIDLLLGSTPDPNERIYLLFSKSSCHGILGNFEEARQQLSLALQQEPEDPDIRLNVEFNEGLLLQQEGKYREAFERLSTLLSDYPERLSQKTPAQAELGRGTLESCAWNYFFNSFRISRAALAPEPPVNPAPGCVPEPQRYRFWIGVR